ncbi:uncharacterized protein H6S33_000491 [Morchella sextelata]|uniref:uncharacterized protein n=1 Tax=Morchella sextelata TaxID=1174677 RepID=UPI001D03A927|nr:uncharacterized protein H6S33_000491 [Morchella sextelata]KAH0614855.1 hypothetical protein H6S33_000491 [Morchella sextelata]
MAEQPPGALSAAFPPPPTFFTHFTPENLAALKELRGADGALPPAELLPEELKCLVPPPLPEGGYRAFGETWTLPEIYPSLAQSGIQQLYPDPTTATPNGKEKALSLDRTLELRRLSQSLLLNYLELVGVMGIAPEQFHEKTAALETILFNMHHLINEYRPHQARETLCLRMEEQLEKIRRETEENRRVVGQIEEVLAGLAGVGERAEALVGEVVGGRKGKESGEERRERAVARDREAWRMLGLGGA